MSQSEMSPSSFLAPNSPFPLQRVKCKALPNLLTDLYRAAGKPETERSAHSSPPPTAMPRVRPGPAHSLPPELLCMGPASGKESLPGRLRGRPRLVPTHTVRQILHSGKCGLQTRALSYQVTSKKSEGNRLPTHTSDLTTLLLVHTPSWRAAAT